MQCSQVGGGDLEVAGGDLEDLLDEGQQLQEEGVQGYGLRRPSRKAGLGLAVSAAACCALAFSVVAPKTFPTMARADDFQATQGKAGALDAMASALKSMATVTSDAQTVVPDVQDTYNTMMKPLQTAKSEVQSPTDVSALIVNMTEMSNMSKQELLKPGNQDRHDGNVCPAGEESHVGLCYKTCSSLTHGRYPIRTTAFACCMEMPCSFFNSKFTNLFTPCHGFDVAGARQGGGCPHQPGDCMPNEEFSLGICYQKCAILTNNKFPFRSGADACCRYNNHFACLDVLNTNTSVTFNVGGGLGDHHNSTPGVFHPPLLNITENTPANAIPGAVAPAADAAVVP